MTLKAGGNILLSSTTKNEGPRKRHFAQWLAYNEFKNLAVENSTKKVAIVDGVHCDDKNELMVVIDYVLGSAHESVMKHKKLLTL